MEMRRNIRSLMLWSAVIGLLIFFTMSFFRTVLQYQQQIAGMVQMVPAVAMKMRGFSNINVLSPSYGIEPWRMTAFIGVYALLILVSGFIYRRKDILT
jgi:hypothetical protein